MSEEQFVSIHVWLAGRSYRIRIKPEEEETVRRAAKVADEKISDLRNHYAGKDDQDFVAMCLLMYAADSGTELAGNPLFQSELTQIIDKIDQVIGEDQPVSGENLLDT